MSQVLSFAGCLHVTFRSGHLASHTNINVLNMHQHCRDFTGALAARLVGKAGRVASRFRPSVEQYAANLTEEQREAVAAAAATRLETSIEESWQAKGYGSAFARGVGIWTFAARILWQESRLRKENDVAIKAAKRAAIAIQLREGLLELGPTFIKLGQLLSTRIDVVPAEYIAELTQLQDRVPGFAGARAISIVEAELGRPISEVYATFDATPLAAASLGQVSKMQCGHPQDGCHCIGVESSQILEGWDLRFQMQCLLCRRWRLLNRTL